MKKLVAACLAFLAAPAWAQTPPAAPPPPRCEEAPYRAFDFWVGEWEVFNPAGARIGGSSITKEEAGCLIVERWRNAKGAAGQSHNFYDRDRKVWRQLWSSPTEFTEFSGGLNDKGQMVLEGVSQQTGGGNDRSLGTWTKNADGSVTQNFKSWDEKTKSWTESFTGIYRKKA